MSLGKKGRSENFAQNVQ